MIGYFEGLDSERGIVWRCADSYSLRDLLQLSAREKNFRSFAVVEDAVASAALSSRAGFGFVLKLGASKNPWANRG